MKWGGWRKQLKTAELEGPAGGAMWLNSNGSPLRLRYRRPTKLLVQYLYSIITCLSSEIYLAIFPYKKCRVLACMYLLIFILVQMWFSSAQENLLPHYFKDEGRQGTQNAGSYAQPSAEKLIYIYKHEDYSNILISLHINWPLVIILSQSVNLILC